MGDVTNLDNEFWVRSLENKQLAVKIYEIDDQKPRMFKVLQILRDAQPEAYEPSIVSLGPYHHQKLDLRDMNHFKWLLLNKLTEISKKSLRTYLIFIRNNEAIKVRNAYQMNMDENQFVEMMLLDCVFVIMILYSWKHGGLKTIENPIFMSGERSRVVMARDMLLLENQLPFFFLEDLFNFSFPSNDTRGKLKEWLVQFLSHLVDNKISQVPNNQKIHHILHLFYLWVVTAINNNNNNHHPTSSSSSSSNEIATSSSTAAHQQNENAIPQPAAAAAAGVQSKNQTANYNRPTLRGSLINTVPSATRLKEAGIKFKKKQQPINLLDITFENGVLEIPPIEVDDDTNVLLRNLIALEQCDTTIVDYFFTTYAFFMSCIIDTAADVEILQRKDIIISGLGGNKKVARLFNELCKEVVVDTSKCYLSQVFKEVSEHSSRKCNIWRAYLTQKHFGNPCLIISLIVAILLFGIVVAQLIFTILHCAS